MAAFSRTPITPNSPYDRYLNREQTALTDAQATDVVAFLNGLSGEFPQIVADRNARSAGDLEPKRHRTCWPAHDREAT